VWRHIPVLVFACRQTTSMLFSPATRIAFAHYPKTAGTSITCWFQTRWSDAAYLDPSNCHLPVRAALQRLGVVAAPGRRPKVVRECLRLVRRVAPRTFASRNRCDLPIIGVVREPFAMLVSLFEYWRRCEFETEPVGPLVSAARTGSFREFLELAVGERLLINYRAFFDIDGPAWPTTRLIAFESLESGLAAVCREFGLEPPSGLDHRNAAPRGRRDLGASMAEAGSLLFEVRTHFRWYYAEAASVLVRGEREARSRAA
jgi:hypothetical protein